MSHYMPAILALSEQGAHEHGKHYQPKRQPLKCPKCRSRVTKLPCIACDVRRAIEQGFKRAYQEDWE